MVHLHKPRGDFYPRTHAVGIVTKGWDGISLVVGGQF